MGANLLYSVGTLATWAGLAFAISAVAQLAKLLLRQPDVNQKTLLRSSALGALLFIAGFVLVKPLSESGFKIPLVWFVMPYSAWLGFGALALGLSRMIQAITAINSEEARQRWMGMIYCIVFALAMGYLYTLDSDNKITILTGGIQMVLTTFFATLLLGIAAVTSMALTAKSAKAKGFGKTLVTQLALIAGSVVFGIPFVFLLVTSFKEDIDMTSPNGIVWIPKVTKVVPYFSPDMSKKHFETQYNGRIVEALIIGEEAGKLKMDIFKPIAIRGVTFLTTRDQLKEVPVEAKVYTAKVDGVELTGFERESLEDGRKIIQTMSPDNLKGKIYTLLPDAVKPVRFVGLRTQNYPEALSYLPPETLNGLIYIKNTLILVIMGVIGTLLSSSLVAYGFSRLQFPGREKLFTILLSTMMLPGAVTMLPQFLIFKNLGWIDTLYPLWVPAFFGSAFNIFLLRQFFSQIPMELEDAAKMDGCTYLKTFWEIMIPQIKPALAVIAIWTFMGAWNNFMGPLIYINSPENMPLSYALNLFRGDRTNEPGLLMAFTTLTVIPVIGLFVFTQKYFIEGVTLSGLGGR
jgi:multiple sugar transport system permease protein